MRLHTYILVALVAPTFSCTLIPVFSSMQHGLGERKASVPLARKSPASRPCFPEGAGFDNGMEAVVRIYSQLPYIALWHFFLLYSYSIQDRWEEIASVRSEQ